VIDNLSAPGSRERAGQLRKAGVEVVESDVRSLRSLIRAAGESRSIYHLAALSSVPRSFENPRLDYQINATGTVNVLEMARRLDAKVVFTSSSTVYGVAQVAPTPEEHPCRPISFYGLSKRVAEEYCRVYHENYGLRVVSLRLFNVYGPGARTGVSYDFLKKLQADTRRLEVIGSGDQSKDFVYVDDVVEALVRSMGSGLAAGNAYNIGSGETTNVLSLARMILRLLGLEGRTEIVLGAIEDWPGDVTFTHADISRARGDLGWAPKVNLGDGLARTISWFQSVYGPVVR
jgi:UDP-glucose 4-epimerase